MMNQCNISAHDLPCSESMPNKDINIWVKNGMARKAFMKNVATSNIKKLKKQINKGTVKIYIL